jgi:hypothetical protein
MLNACGLPGNPESFIPPDSEALAIEESPKQEGKSSALESSGKSRAFLDVLNERHECSSLMLLTWTGPSGAKLGRLKARDISSD